MLALLIPFLLTAMIIVMTLGISFLCFEIVLRTIGKGLGAKPEAIRQPINNRVVVQAPSDKSTVKPRSTVKTRLQAA